MKGSGEWSETWTCGLFFGHVHILENSKNPQVSKRPQVTKRPQVNI